MKGLVSVIGSGEISTKISMILAKSGKFHAKMIDFEEESLSRSYQFIRKNLEKSIEQGKIDHERFYFILKRFSVALNLNFTRNSSFLMDFRMNDLQKWGKIWNDLQKESGDTVFCISPSALQVVDKENLMERQEKVIGVQFEGLEEENYTAQVIRGKITSEESFQKTAEMIKNLGIKLRIE
jgi:3-hydroxybutyryl-CoA dehydrogenase